MPSWKCSKKMKVSPFDQININQQPQNQKAPDALRRAAIQFEAVLLMQLTSALNNANNNDEDSLFGSDGGSGLAKQMFSEQLATTMAQSGGIGLSAMILRQFGGTEANSVSSGIKGLSGVIAAVKDMKENVQPTADKNASVTLKKSAKADPITKQEFMGYADGAEIVSTFEDDLKTGGIDDSLKNLMLDGKLVNSTRARIVPNSQVTEIQGISSSRLLGSSAKVAFQIPVNGRISSEFGNRFHPIDRKTKFHGGIDIAVAKGTPVAAAAEGVVTFAGWSKGYGNLVIVKHPDGRETRYGHLEKILVSEDAEVACGQQIALSGSTGKSTGPHLHFEVRENGQVVNPFRILSNVLPKNAER